MYCMDFYNNFFEVPEDKIHVLILIDGMGMNIYDTLDSASIFKRNFYKQMLSVYPSTTAVALSSLASRREPGELGVTGWTTYLPERGQLVNVLTSKPEWSNETDNSIVGDSLLVASSFRSSSVNIINPAPFIDQAYNNWVSTQGCAQSTGYLVGDNWMDSSASEHWMNVSLNVLENAKPGSLLYLYLPMVDAGSHVYGWDSPKTMDILRHIEQGIEHIIDKTSTGPHSGSVVFSITADHGHINIPKDKYHYVDANTPWMKNLVTSFSGEGRNPVFHILPGKEEEFRQQFKDSEYGDLFDLFTPEKLCEMGLFAGSGISTAARPRWGSLVGVANSAVYLEMCREGHKSKNFIGVHGGISTEERNIPLIRIET